MELIRQYAGLSMVCGAAMLLLPRGKNRQTAALAMGLIIALFWCTGLRGILRLPDIPAAPASLLTAVPSAGADYAALMSRVVSAQTDQPVSFTWENGALRQEGR